jgi:YVTN family beta-propeller protein
MSTSHSKCHGASPRVILRAAVLVVAALGLASCGGGSGGGSDGGGGGGGGGGPLQMSGFPAYGRTSAGGPLVQTFNVLTASPATQVGPNDFPAAVAGQNNFFELRFSKNLAASSITGTSAGTAGVSIQRDDGAIVTYALDPLGQIDPSNTFPSPGVAPSALRLYVQDSVLFPGAPTQLTPGQYVVVIEPTRLRGAANEQFCVQTGAGGGCVQSPRVSYSFTVGGDTTPPAGAGNGAFEPVVGSTIATNQEVRIFLSENIDYQSVVGRSGQGPNTTQRDPFMSRVFPVNNLNMNATAFGENIVVQYTAPPGTALPSNYGFVVYMPDPFHNPTEMRLRFVDRTLNVSNDTFPSVQSYGLDFHTWTSAGLTAPTNNAGQPLTLPAILPLPGTTSAGPATLQIVLGSSGAAFATDASTNQDGVRGVTDRARNALASDVTVNPVYSVQVGPEIFNWPSPPDLSIVAGDAHRVHPISAGKLTNNALPVVFGGQVTGILNVPPTTLDDLSVLGNVVDMEFGRFVNFNSPRNIIHNPPRRSTIPVPVTSNNGDAAIPFPQGGTPEANLFPLIIAPLGPPTPPLGVNLYVVDGTANVVKVFESTTMTLLTTLAGIPSPGGLGIDPNLNFLYVSNVDQGTISKVGASPFQSTLFHQIAATITVGAGPRAISVNPANEDVFVVNTGENTVSIIDVPGQAERTRLAVGNGPRDVFITDRFNCAGCTVAYMAFVTNFFGNSVSVYESDSPLITVNNGPDGKVIDTLIGFDGPSGGCWNRFSNIGLAPVFMGAYIANSLGTTIENRGATNFGLSPTPGFQGPPGFRTFSTVATYSTSALAGGPSDVTIENMTALSQASGPSKALAKADIPGVSGVPSVLLVTYPAAGQVAAYDLPTGTFFGSVPVPGSALYTYYDQ